MATALTPIAWQSLASASASVTFSSIPGTYRDLRLVVTYTTSVNGGFYTRLNGDSAANYSQVSMTGNGSTASSTSSSGSTAFYDALQLTNSSTSIGMAFFDYLDYSATDKHKTILIRAGNNGTPGPGTEASTARWASTAAITSMVLTAPGATFSIGTTFALYGVGA